MINKKRSKAQNPYQDFNKTVTLFSYLNILLMDIYLCICFLQKV